ncbi:MAG: hypothetical protein MPJ50_05200 [Pirellulales bacterium]|nr:hypothetical protein [Pirellulales bacterium]
MADQEQQPESTEEDVAVEGASPRPRRRKLMVIGFLAAVVTCECLLAAMYLPSASDVAPVDDITLAKQQLGDVEETPTDAMIDVDATDLVEVDLSNFSVTSFQPESNTTLRIQCQLYATVHKDDESEFGDLYGKYENRVRDGILRIFRSAESIDFADSGLGLIKRSISEKVNEILGEPLVRGIIVSEFDFYEQ